MDEEHYEFGDPYVLNEYDETSLDESDNSLLLTDFIPTTGCGLFRPEGVCTLLMYDLRRPFEFVWMKRNGRERLFQFALDDEDEESELTNDEVVRRPTTSHSFFFEIHSSGYGDIQEKILFSENFPEGLKFRLCKAMARRYIRMELNHLRLQKGPYYSYTQKEIMVLEDFLESLDKVDGLEGLKSLAEDTSIRRYENYQEKEREKKD